MSQSIYQSGGFQLTQHRVPIDSAQGPSHSVDFLQVWRLYLCVCVAPCRSSYSNPSPLLRLSWWLNPDPRRNRSSLGGRQITGVGGSYMSDHSCMGFTHVLVLLDKPSLKLLLMCHMLHNLGVDISSLASAWNSYL